MNDIAFSVIINNDGIDDIIFKTIMLKGEKGNSVARVEKTSTSGLVDTYTIYLTDGTIGGTFTVTNGNDINIDDSVVSASKTWSSQKLSGMIKEIDDSDVDADKLWSSAKINSLMPQTATIEDVAMASFSDGADNVPVSELIVDITAVQAGSGVPSPDNERAISGWDECNVTKCGKNLCNPSDLKDQSGWNYIIIKAKPNTSYVMSGNLASTDTGTMPLFFLSSTTSPSTTTNVYSGHPVIITTNADGILKIQQRRVSGTDSFANYQWQIEEGTTATPYEEYNGGTDTIDFGQTVYGCEVDVINGTGLKTWSDKITFDGSTSVNSVRQSGSTWYIIVAANLDGINTTEDNPNVICDKFVTRSGISGDDNHCYITSNGKLFVCVLTDQTITTKEQANEWFQNNPITFIYKLATPTPISTTPTEVKTLLGINNIFADTGNINKLVYFKTGSEAVARMIEAYLRT